MESLATLKAPGPGQTPAVSPYGSSLGDPTRLPCRGGSLSRGLLPRTVSILGAALLTASDSHSSSPWFTGTRVLRRRWAAQVLGATPSTQARAAGHSKAGHSWVGTRGGRCSRSWARTCGRVRVGSHGAAQIFEQRWANCDENTGWDEGLQKEPLGPMEFSRNGGGAGGWEVDGGGWAGISESGAKERHVAVKIKWLLENFLIYFFN